MEDLFTIADAAKILCVHPNTLYRWARSGRVEGYRLAGSKEWRFTEGQLTECLRKYKDGNQSC